MIRVKYVFRGASVNEKNHRSETPLHLATYRENQQICQFLLEHGARADVLNNDGKTAYNIAESKNNQSLQKLFNTFSWEGMYYWVLIFLTLTLS